MGRKRLLDDSIAGKEEARRMEKKYASLKEDYADLQRLIRASRQRARRATEKKNRLLGEFRFLQRKYKMLTKEDHEEPANPSKSPEFGTKIHSVHKKFEKPNDVLAIEDKPTGLQPSIMKKMAASTKPHSLLVSPIVEPTNKKKCLKNSGLVSAQKPSKVKNGRNKKIKATIFVSEECGVGIPSISRNPTKQTQEDGPPRHDLIGLQVFSSTDDYPSPDTTGLQPSAVLETGPTFTILESSSVTPVIKSTGQEDISLKIMERGMQSIWDN